MHAALKTFAISLHRQIWRHRLLACLALLAPWIILRSGLGIALAVLVCLADFWWIQRQTQKHLFDWLNAHIPELEDSAQLLALAQPQSRSAIEALQSQRLQARLQDVLTPSRLAALARQIAFGALSVPRFVLVLNCLLAVGVMFLMPTATTQLATSPASSASAATAKPTLRLRVTPPAYTAQARFESDAKTLQIPEHSTVEWCLDGDSKAVRDTMVNTLIRLSNGQDIPFQVQQQQRCAQWDASETVFWRWSDDPAQSRYTLKVVLDQAPQISLKEPSELLQVLSNQAQAIAMSIQISDDYQVQTASLHLTLARGSGENIRFSDKEVPIPQGADKRQRQWSKRWTLSELRMEPGDELYFFVRATDNAGKNPHTVTSPTYTIRLPSPEASAEEVSVLPILAKPESLRSQRQIIIDTEQLLSDMAANPRLNPSVVRNRSEVIANDQAALRRRYGRFLGEESSLFGDEHGDEHGDDHAQAGQAKSGDLAAQYGHAHDQEENATLFDEATKAILRRALVAMWDAEKALRAITPKAALAPENKALEAIKQLQQADRIYLHKAAFTPPPIKEEKRFSGDVLEVKNKQRAQADWSSAVAPELQQIIVALGSNQALPALWTSTARAAIAANLKEDAQRLQAQASVQDVADGCQPCRVVLAAWLRQGIVSDGIKLQATPRFKSTVPSQFERAWRGTTSNSTPVQAK